MVLNRPANLNSGESALARRGKRVPTVWKVVAGKKPFWSPKIPPAFHASAERPRYLATNTPQIPPAPNSREDRIPPRASLDLGLFLSLGADFSLLLGSGGCPSDKKRYIAPADLSSL